MEEDISNVSKPLFVHPKVQVLFILNIFGQVAFELALGPHIDKIIIR